jgi:hypothetical protein
MTGVGFSDNAADRLDLGPSPELEHYMAILDEAGSAINRMTGQPTAETWHSGGGIWLLKVELGAEWYITAGQPDDRWSFVIDKDGEGWHCVCDDDMAMTDSPLVLARSMLEMVMWWSDGARLQRLPSFVKAVEVF